MANLSAFIDAQHLRYAYAKNPAHRALNNISLSICQDEYLLICGASGSGKSTLCRTFNGLIPHFYGGKLKGRIHVAGKSTKNQSVADLSAFVGMVFQNAEAQLFNRTVKQEIAFSLESMGLVRDDIIRRISETTEMMGIAHLLARHPHQLSTGEQQLVSIAAILATRPQIIVLDEPYANLDHRNIRRVRAALKKIHRQHLGVAVCEHRLPLTAADARQMIVVNNGQLVSNGAPHEVLKTDVEDYGLEPPLSVRIGRRLKLAQLPLDTPALMALALASGFPVELKPPAPPPLPANSPIVAEMENVTFELEGKAILRDINFALHRGECMAVVGANGAGKTTLLKHLNGLLRPSYGRIRILGHDAGKTKVSQLAGFVGMAFQNPDHQFFKLRVWDEISVGAKALNRFDESWVLELADLFSLKPLLERSPYRLSGGEKKRVAFAAALACRPDILALDEPTAGQDFGFRKKLGNVIRYLLERSQAILLVTHDLSFAEQHAHRWLVLSQGQIIAEGSPGDIMANKAAMRQAELEPTEAFLLYGSKKC